MSDSKRLTVSARAKVVIELSVGCWGSECSLTQILDQAKDTAINRILSSAPDGIRIVGQPVITVVWVGDAD